MTPSTSKRGRAGSLLLTRVAGLLVRRLRAGADAAVLGTTGTATGGGGRGKKSLMELESRSAKDPRRSDAATTKEAAPLTKSWDSGSDPHRPQKSPDPRVSVAGTVRGMTDERRYSELSEPEKLARLWQLLPGYVAAVARREGVTPHRGLEGLRERLPDDETWYAELAAIDAGVREALSDPSGTMEADEEAM